MDLDLGIDVGMVVVGVCPTVLGTFMRSLPFDWRVEGVIGSFDVLGFAADELVELRVVDSIGREAVRTTLKKWT